MRFRMLETLREYAREGLPPEEWPGVAQAHGSHYLRFAEQAHPELSGAERRRWLDRLEVEEDNLRAAFDWFLQTEQAEATLRLAHALGSFWQEKGRHTEALQRIAAALSLPETPPSVRPLPPAPCRLGGTFAALRARALRTAGRLAWTHAEYATSRAYFEESLSVCRATGDRGAAGDCLTGLAMVALSLGDTDAAEPHIEEALKIHRETGDRFREAINLVQSGNLARRRGEYAAARSRCEEALAMQRDLGYPREQAVCLSHLGLIAYEQRDLDAAQRHYEEALAICTHVGGERGAGLARLGLARTAHCWGRIDAARALAADALAAYRRAGNRTDLTAALALLAALALQDGELDGARALIVEAGALPVGSRAKTTRSPQLDRSDLARRVAALLRETGDEPGVERVVETCLEIRSCPARSPSGRGHR